MPWLAIILVLAGLCRLPYITAPFIRVEEWGMAQFSLYAGNYHKFGYLDSGFFPLYGKVGEILFPYSHHPPLASVLLGLWTGVVGNSEASARVLSILFGLGTIAVLAHLGRVAFGKEAGLWTAGIFAFMPLSIYLGHFYTMEIPQMFFTLVALAALLRWDETARRRDGILTGFWLAVGYACDIYPAFLCPAFFLWGLYDWKRGASKRKVLGWMALAAVGPLCVLLQLGVVHVYFSSESLLVSGVSRYSQPWALWFDFDYHWGVLSRVVRYTAVLPVLAIPAVARKKGWTRPQALLVFMLSFLVIADFLVLSAAVLHHNYRVMFFLPLIALLSGVALAPAKRGIQVVFIILYLGLSWINTVPFYRPLRPADVETSRLIREATTPKDILVALPPHMAYYVDREALVPYYFLWRHPDLYDEAAALFADLHPLAELEGYERIVLFTQLAVPASAPKYDWSKAFDGVPNLERVTDPGVDPQVWKFVKDP